MSTIVLTLATRSVSLVSTWIVTGVVLGCLTWSVTPGTALVNSLVEEVNSNWDPEVPGAPTCNKASRPRLVCVIDRPSPEASTTSCPACPDCWLVIARRYGLAEPSENNCAVTPAFVPLILFCKSARESPATSWIVSVVEPSRTWAGWPPTVVLVAVRSRWRSATAVEEESSTCELAAPACGVGQGDPIAGGVDARLDVEVQAIDRADQVADRLDAALSDADAGRIGPCCCRS